MAGSRKTNSTQATTQATTQSATQATSNEKPKRVTKKQVQVEPEPEQHVEAVETVEAEEVEQGASSNDDQTSSESKFDALFKSIQTELREIKDRQSGLTLTLRKLESAHRAEIKSVRKHKQKRNGQHKPTGFAKKQVVPSKLAKFISVKEGTELTGPEITSAIWKQLKSRKLTWEKDKRVFRTNPEVTALFGVPASVNKSEDHKDENGFNFCNLQKFIAYALKGSN